MKNALIESFQLTHWHHRLNYRIDKQQTGDCDSPSNIDKGEEYETLNSQLLKSSKHKQIVWYSLKLCVRHVQILFTFEGYLETDLYKLLVNLHVIYVYKYYIN